MPYQLQTCPQFGVPLEDEELLELELLDELLELDEDEPPPVLEELELLLDDELLDDELELLELLEPVLVPQAPTRVQDASLPGTELVYQFALYRVF